MGFLLTCVHVCAFQHSYVTLQPITAETSLCSSPLLLPRSDGSSHSSFLCSPLRTIYIWKHKEKLWKANVHFRGKYSIIFINSPLTAYTSCGECRRTDVDGNATLMNSHGRGYSIYILMYERHSVISAKALLNCIFEMFSACLRCSSHSFSTGPRSLRSLSCFMWEALKERI